MAVEGLQISGNAQTPWHIPINVLTTPSATPLGSWSAALSSSALNNGYRTVSSLQNAEIDWDIVLGAGTWTISMLFAKNTTHGIYSVQLDGVEVGTVDGYAASLTWNLTQDITGVVVAATGKKRLGLKMATKNASSTGFGAALIALALIRTA